jgi:hypothetical protein
MNKFTSIIVLFVCLCSYANESGFSIYYPSFLYEYDRTRVGFVFNQNNYSGNHFYYGYLVDMNYSKITNTMFNNFNNIWITSILFNIGQYNTLSDKLLSNFKLGIGPSLRFSDGGYIFYSINGAGNSIPDTNNYNDYFFSICFMFSAGIGIKITDRIKINIDEEFDWNLPISKESKYYYSIPNTTIIFKPKIGINIFY